jgi:DHA1 family bicyclomycin/chloramphenicol resistance-like MFS transporter
LNGAVRQLASVTCIYNPHPNLNKQETSLRLTVLLGVLIALPALGTDLFVPALPRLAEMLSVDVATAQFTLTTYFVGLGAGMLVWGPLSDRYGRKPVLLVGLATMLAASLTAAFVDSAGAVAAARLAQGLSMASGAVIGRAVVRDLHAHEQAARLLARMTMVFSVVPLTAPVIGAVISVGAGWRAIFWCFALVGAVLIAAAAVGLKETAPLERRSVHPADILRTFRSILADPRFIAPFLLILCAHVGILAWVSSSAFVLVRGFGIEPAVYGLAFGAVMLGQICGAWTSSRLVMRLGIPRLLRIGTTTMLAAGTAAAALAWSGVVHWAAVVLPFLAFLFGSALTVPNAMAAAITPFPASAGAAVSLVGAVGFGIGALISTVLGAAFDGTARPMTALAAVGGVGAFVLNRWKASTP